MPNPRKKIPLIAAVLLAACCSVAYAAAQTQPQLQLLPPPPPMNPNEQDGDLEPQVTIIKKAEQTVEEYRIGGKLYMIRVTPTVGAPYYMVDDLGDGSFVRHDTLSPGVRPPRWVIHRF
ncbi:MAG: DUF2782 domain-containing protein [Pseudomonadota bacterium]